MYSNSCRFLIFLKLNDSQKENSFENHFNAMFRRQYVFGRYSYGCNIYTKGVKLRTLRLECGVIGETGKHAE